MPNSRRYIITLTDAESREVVVFTDVHWTTEQRRIANAGVPQIVGGHAVH
jgi:hypothetical protein